LLLFLVLVVNQWATVHIIARLSSIRLCFHIWYGLRVLLTDVIVDYVLYYVDCCQAFEGTLVVIKRIIYVLVGVTSIFERWIVSLLGTTPVIVLHFFYSEGKRLVDSRIILVKEGGFGRRGSFHKFYFTTVDNSRWIIQTRIWSLKAIIDVTTKGSTLYRRKSLNIRFHIIKVKSIAIVLLCSV